MFEHIINDLATKDQNWDVLEVLHSVAQDEEATAPQVALSWVTNRPAVGCSIIGARNMRQLSENLAAADLRLKETSTALLDQVSHPRPNDYPYGDFGRKQVGRYVASSEAVLGELFARSGQNEGTSAEQGRPAQKENR
jgi:aryl-alcohol dehydrogenase (NADP+)